MNKDDRYYNTPFGQLPSVTTVLGVINKPFLIHWALKEGREKTIEVVWELLQSNDLVNIGKDDLRKIITHSIKESERVKQNALDAGSLFHNAIESYYKDWEGDWQEYVEFISEFYPQVGPMLTKFFGLVENLGIEIVESELTVFNPIGYAGTLDCIAKIHGLGGATCIGDFKTSNRFSWEYCLQTEAYRRAYNLMHGEEIRHRFVVRVDKKDFGVEFYYIDPAQNEDDWQAFLACLTLFNRIKKEEL